MNSSNSALTSDDERRNIGNLISFFILRVNYGRDFEQQLSFYVDARGLFPNLDSVLHTLVSCVNKLSMDTRRIVKGNHSRKTAAFVKACAAFSFITIPSIISTIQRLDLYLSTGEVALANVCLGQADASLEAALNLLPEIPRIIEIDGRQRSSEFYLQSYVLKFLSFLIVVPVRFFPFCLHPFTSFLSLYRIHPNKAFCIFSDCCSTKSRSTILRHNYVSRRFISTYSTCFAGAHKTPTPTTFKTSCLMISFTELTPSSSMKLTRFARKSSKSCC